MQYKTFLVKYEIQFKDGSGLLGKEMKIKNCLSGVQAQVRLEEYLKKKYPNFKALIVNKCTEDFMGVFDNMFGASGGNPFGDVFGGMFGGEK